VRDELRTPLYDFTSATHPVLVFDRAYARYSSGYPDSLAVLASNDCGQTFTLLYLKGTTALATAPDYTSGMFEPTASQWAKDTIDLLAYAGQGDILFAFQNRGHYGQALYLDNINISDLLATDVGQNEKTEISVYPNPSSGPINFSGTEKGSKLEIFDVSGRKIHETICTSDIQSIDISKAAKGMYYYRITKEMKLVKSGEICIE
jgi:hypothetical protein